MSDMIENLPLFRKVLVQNYFGGKESVPGFIYSAPIPRWKDGSPGYIVKLSLKSFGGDEYIFVPTAKIDSTDKWLSHIWDFEKECQAKEIDIEFGSLRIRTMLNQRQYSVLLDGKEVMVTNINLSMEIGRFPELKLIIRR